MHVPEAANKLVWVTINYITHLKSTFDRELVDESSRQTELATADKVVRLFT